MTSCFLAVGGRGRGKKAKILFHNIKLDNYELVLLASENGSFAVSPTAMSSHTITSLNPAAGPKEKQGGFAKHIRVQRGKPWSTVITAKKYQTPASVIQMC